MKKYIFLFLVTFLLVLILLYFYDKKEIVMNNKYKSDNVYIEYPYFNNKNIDLYIDNYLNNAILDDNNYYFVDYDYVIDGNNIDLIMYKYIYNNNVMKSDITKYIVSTDNGRINRVSDISLNNKYNEKVNKDNLNVAFVFLGDFNINTVKILDILSKYNVKATFCVNNSDYKMKIEKLDMEVIDDCNVGYTINSYDDKYHSSKIINSNILKNIRDGDVILMHGIYSATVNSLEIIIPILINNGYNLVKLSDLNIL